VQKGWQICSHCFAPLDGSRYQFSILVQCGTDVHPHLWATVCIDLHAFSFHIAFKIFSRLFLI
jgi:hypothetical protein